jgi:hypothetical protein
MRSVSQCQCQSVVWLCGCAGGAFPNSWGTQLNSLTDRIVEFTLLNTSHFVCHRSSSLPQFTFTLSSQDQSASSIALSILKASFFWYLKVSEIGIDPSAPSDWSSQEVGGWDKVILSNWGEICHHSGEWFQVFYNSLMMKEQSVIFMVYRKLRCRSDLKGYFIKSLGHGSLKISIARIRFIS